MKHYNKISQLMQGILSKETVEKLGEGHQYTDTGRKMTLFTLFQYFLLSALLKADSFRDLALQGVGYNLPEVHYSTLSKKAKEVPFQIYLDAFMIVFEACNREKKRYIRSKYGRILKAIDSTRIVMNERKWNWAPYQKGKSGLKFHTAYMPDAGIPSQLLVSPINTGDSTVLGQFAEYDTLLLCDRGYLNIQTMAELDVKGQEFIIRIRNHVNQLNRYEVGLPYDSSKYEDYLCTLGKDRDVPKEFRNHQFRVVKFMGRGGETVTLCTNVVDLTAEEIADLYAIRWQIECFFKELKQHFTIKTIFGQSANAAFSQGIIAFICFLVTHCIYTELRPCLPPACSFLTFLRYLKYHILPFDSDKFQSVLLLFFG